MFCEPGLWQDHDLLLQLLRWEQEVPHDLIQFLQGQLGMEPGDIIGFQMHHMLQQAIQILEDITQHLGRERGSRPHVCWEASQGPSTLEEGAGYAPH